MRPLGAYFYIMFVVGRVAIGNQRCRDNNFLPHRLRSHVTAEIGRWYWIIILPVYLRWPCDLELWPIDIGVMWFAATCVVTPVPSLKWACISTIKMLHSPTAESPNFVTLPTRQGSLVIFLTPKHNTLARTTCSDVLWRGMREKMVPVTVAKKQKRKQLLFVKLVICPDHARWWSPWNSHVGYYHAKVIFQLSWTLVERSRICKVVRLGSKIAISHRRGPWLIQKLVVFCQNTILSYHYCRHSCATWRTRRKRIAI